MSAVTRMRLFGILLGYRRHLLRPDGGAVALDPRGGDPRTHAPQVLDESQAQHDGDGPQFAQLQRGHRLVGRHETSQALHVHPSIAVRDRFQRDVVHARQARRRAAAQAGQLPAVALRQVPPGRADLLLDQVEVVEQPFPCRDDAAVGRQRLGQKLAGFDQDSFVVGQPREQAIRSPSSRQLVRSGQGPPVLLHLVGAEQLGAQGRFVGGAAFSKALPRRRAIHLRKVAPTVLLIAPIYRKPRTRLARQSARWRASESMVFVSAKPSLQAASRPLTPAMRFRPLTEPSFHVLRWAQSK